MRIGLVLATALAGAGLMLTAMPGGAMPLSGALSKVAPAVDRSMIDLVQHRPHGGPRPHRGHRGGGGDGGAAAAGILGGLLLGAIIADQARQQNAVEYCMQRYRSYDPYSRTFVGRDGRRHSCP